MPIKLRQVLAHFGIRQIDWCAGIIQTSGTWKDRPISQPMGSLILRWNSWPKNTPKEAIQQQTVEFLRQRNVPEEYLGDDLWEEDNDINPLPRSHSLPTNKPQAATPGACNSANETEPETLPETEMLSQQAKLHFKLFQDPFLDDVQGPDDVYLSSEQRYIRESMFQAAKHGGFLAVVGESGAGKSTLRKDLIDRIRRDSESVTVIQPRIIDKGRLTAGAICDAIITDVSFNAHIFRSLEAKARQVEQLLTESSRAGNTHVLIIEEAHDLSVQTLKYLKRFWEMEDGFKRLLSIILVGQLELNYKLDERTNFAAREVIRRCEVAELRPLNGNLEEYLALKFKRIGKQLTDIFEDDAYDAIRNRLIQRQRGSTATMSMMYPLVVNNTVRKAMNLTVEVGEARVSAEIIKGV